MEVLNFGSSGYGLGQSYLRYLKEGLKYKPDIIFFNYVEMGNRDEFFGPEIFHGRGLRNSDVYRVHFTLKNGQLMTQSMTPLDLFDANFREKYLYSPLGLSQKTSFLSSPFFSISNLGLLIKQFYLQKMFLKQTARDEPYDLAVNLKLLEDLLATAEENHTLVIFFFEQDIRGLPKEIQALLKSYLKEVVYVHSQPMLEKLYQLHGRKREELLNKTNHFNAEGNQIYAEAVALILSGRSWGDGDRKFRLDGDKKAFVRVK